MKVWWGSSFLGSKIIGINDKRLNTIVYKHVDEKLCTYLVQIGDTLYTSNQIGEIFCAR